MKKLIVAAVIAAACGALTAQAKTYSEASLRYHYQAKDALIRNWDGIDNTGRGEHDSTATRWVDCCNSSRYWTLRSGVGSFSDNALVISARNGGAYMSAGSLPSYQSMELGLHWTSGQQVLSNNQNWRIFILNWGDGSFGACRTFYAQDSRVVAGGDYRFSVVYNNANNWPEKYYLNGGRVTKTISKTYGWTEGQPCLGDRYNAGDCVFYGSIYYIRLYNRQLTDDEVQKNAAIDNVRYLNDWTEFNELFPQQFEVASELDVPNQKIVISADVFHTDTNETTTLSAIVRRSDGVVTTNEMATAVVASETPYTYDVTNLAGGLNYDVSVLLSDTSGYEREITTTTIFVGEMTVTAGVDADVTQAQNGTFILSRGSAQETDLIVNYTLEGTAVNGTDYQALSGTVTIPAGASEVTINIAPIITLASTNMTVTMKLAPGGYTPSATAHEATIRILAPDFTRGWTYDSTTHRLTDGVWTFNTSGNLNSLTLTSLHKCYFSKGPLDFSKPLPEGCVITTFGASVLNGNKVVTDITLPPGLTTFGSYAVYNCTSLTNMTPFLPTTVTTIGICAFQYCTALKGDLVIGNGGRSVTLSSGNPNGMQFQSTKIDTLTIGPGVTQIHDDVFRGCSALKEVHLPETLTKLGGYCFENCQALTNVVPMLPASLTSIGTYVFSSTPKLAIDVVIGTNNTAVTMGDNGRQFLSSGIKSIRFGKGAKTVPGWCCEWCYDLHEAWLDEGVQTVKHGAFQSCGLQYLHLPTNSLKTIEQDCFRTRLNGDSRSRALVSIEPFLPRSLTTIGSRCFCLSFGSAMSDLVLDNANGQTLTLAFGGDTGWQFEKAPCTRLTIGRGITQLPSGCFQEMTHVKELYFTGVLPTYTAYTTTSPFNKWGTRQACVYVPATEGYWNDFLTNETKVTPWVKLNDNLKREFKTNFPGKPRPYGMTIGPNPPTSSSVIFGCQWIYRGKSSGTCVVVR